MNINFPSLLRGSKPNLSYAYALKLLLILANILIGSIAPSISFLLSIMIFSCLRRKEKSLFIINIFSLSFFAAVTYSSRAFLLIESDDYIRYYDSYINASNLNKAIYFEEPGLLWFYDIIHLISPSLTSSGLSFLTLFFTLLILGCFFYVLCFYNLKLKKIGICFSFIYLLVSVDYMNQLVRQSIALIFILFILLNISTIKKFFLLILSFTFHFSTLPILLLFYLIKNFSAKKIVIFAIIFTFSIVIIFNTPYIQNYLGRLSYYSFNIYNIELNWYIKYIALILVLSLFFKGCNENQFWNRLLTILAILVIITIPLGLLSLRLFSLYIIFFIGLHFYLLLESQPPILLFFLIIFFILKTMNILLVNENINDYFSLWQTYDKYALNPFYYFSEY